MKKISIETVIMRLAIGMEIGDELARAVVNGVCEDMKAKDILNEDLIDRSALANSIEPSNSATDVNGNEPEEEAKPVINPLEQKLFERSLQMIRKVLAARAVAKKPKNKVMLEGGVLSREKVLKKLLGAADFQIIGNSSPITSKEIACVLLEIMPQPRFAGHKRAVRIDSSAIQTIA